MMLDAGAEAGARCHDLFFLLSAPALPSSLPEGVSMASAAVIAPQGLECQCLEPPLPEVPPSSSGSTGVGELPRACGHPVH